MQEQHIGVPFNIITGKGLGESQVSKFAQSASAPNTKANFNFLPSQKLGSAKIDCRVNIANGNLCIKDKPIQITEPSGSLKLGFIYNSQASLDARWQLNIKKFSYDDVHNQLMLKEADGHEIKFSFDPETKRYYAKEFANGMLEFYFDAEKKLWVLNHPGKEVIEYFDAQGYLVTRTDKKNRATTFTYDDDKQLKSIVSASGCEYHIKQSYTGAQKEMTIERLENNQTECLHTYTFNSDHQLTMSETADGYLVNYDYANQLLNSIKQSDGTVLSFCHDKKEALTAIRVGEHKKKSTEYKIQCASSNNNEAHIIDAADTQFKFVVGANAELLSAEVAGKDENKKESFTYYANGQLETHTDSANRFEIFSYSPTKKYLLESHVSLQDVITHYAYTDEVHPVIARVSKALKVGENRKELHTDYYYETVADKQLLRFTVSPAGRVTQYQYNDAAALTEIREYTSDFYLQDKTKSALDAKALSAWCDEKRANVKLTKINENARGQIETRSQFAHVDANGCDIENSQASLERFTYDDANHLIESMIKQKEGVEAREKNQYDQLHRLTRAENAKNETTTHAYRDKEVLTTFPNQRQEIVEFAECGAIVAAEISATNSQGAREKRVSQIELDACARPHIKTDAEGNKSYYFYNERHELAYLVNPEGCITEFFHHLAPDYLETIQYATAIDLNLFAGQPIKTFLQKNIKPSQDDQHVLEFYAAQQNCVLAIDGEGFATETLYDSLARNIGERRFKLPLTHEMQASLKAQGLDAWMPDKFSLDERQANLTRNFYDADNFLIASADACGYLTYFKRDGVGAITDKIVYQDKISNLNPQTQFADLQIETLKEHAHTYYFRDQRGQLILEIDPEGYATSYAYLANGLVQSVRRHENKVAPEWFHDTNMQPEIIPSANDKLTEFSYDLLDRKIKETETSGKVSEFTFDNMGNTIATVVYDARESKIDSGDNIR